MDAEVRINPDLIPPEVQEKLAKGCLELVKGLLSQPGGREQMDNWKKDHGLL